jgi:broad specificity phosphatase PhoE
LDPEITQVGIQQARDLGRRFPFHASIEAVFSSPLQRALRTALLAFGENRPIDDRIVALPLAQETSHALCDTGRNVDALKALFPETKVEYQYLEPDWNSKTGRWSQDDVAVEQRATRLRDFLACRPEQEIVLVTHGFFLHFLTEVRAVTICAYQILTLACTGLERVGEERRLYVTILSVTYGHATICPFQMPARSCGSIN